MGVMFTNPDCLELAEVDLDEWPSMDPDLRAAFEASNITTRHARLVLGMRVTLIHCARNRPVEWPVGSGRYYRVID